MNTATSTEQLLVSKVDAARMLSISPRMVDKLIASGDLQTLKIGARTLIPRQALEKFARRGSGPQ